MASSNAVVKKEKKQRTSPPILLLILGLIVVASALTYMIPAGAYDISQETGQYVAGSFHVIEATPVAPWNAIGLIYDSLLDNAGTIMMLLYYGGIIGVFIATGATEDFLAWLLYRLRDKGFIAVIIISTVMMSALGAFASTDALITFVAVGVIICRKLRLDPLVSVGVFYFGCFVGFCAGPTCAYVAQNLAGLPLYSGFLVRTTIWLFFTAVSIVYIVWYSKRILKNPQKSFMGDTRWLDNCAKPGEVEKTELAMSSPVIVTLMFGSFFFSAYALSETGLNWTKGQTFACLAAVAIICGLIRRQTVTEIMDAFTAGVKDMAFICFIVGVAGCIGTVLAAGNILPTIVNAITVPLSLVGKGVSVIVMLIMNLFINILIPSRGAQAALVIPLMNPITDILDITRQVSVTAFNLGDGLSNMINPLDGCTIGAITLAGVSYKQWFKWCFPITVILVILSAFILYFLASIGWTGL